MRLGWAGIVAAAATAWNSAASREARDEQESNMASIEIQRLAIRFSYPDSFLVGRFAPESLPAEAREAGMESPFRNAVVLIQLG